jgi:predicted AAA+ superfamily ATPase
MTVSYWRERNREVDFVLHQGTRTRAIEVKSGRNKGALAGLTAFASAFGTGKGLVVGTGGVPLELFLSTPAADWLKE